jgi:arsenate reductase (glutaredoxin)
MPKEDTIRIYQKPTCSTCREAVKLVEASGRPYEAINYYETPFTKPQLKALLKKAGLRPRDIMRTKEAAYKKLKIGEQQHSDDELIDLLLRYPDLIQRPLVERGAVAMLARPAETVKALLKR